MTRVGLLRRIEPAGSPARYETRVGDNHHHLVCRSCGVAHDVDCVVGAAPCLTPRRDRGLRDRRGRGHVLGHLPRLPGRRRAGSAAGAAAGLARAWPTSDLLFERRGSTARHHVQPPAGAQRDDVRDVRGASTSAARRSTPTTGSACSSCAAPAAGRSSSGTDIRQFLDFDSGRTGVEYEADIDRYVGRLDRLRKPAIALVEGYAVGAGLAIAAACDLRICTPDAQFGLPIARTLGNCLSMAGYARLAAILGEARALDVVFTARMVGAEEAHACGLGTRSSRRTRSRRTCSSLAERSGDARADHAARDEGGAAAPPRGQRPRRRGPRRGGLRQRRLPRRASRRSSRSAATPGPGT